VQISDHAACQWVLLVGRVANQGGVGETNEPVNGYTLKEVVLFRRPQVHAHDRTPLTTAPVTARVCTRIQVVHVYNVVEFGRRFYRSLVYSSDATFCLHADLPASLTAHSAQPMLSAGDPKVETKAKPSLVITRNLTKTMGIAICLSLSLSRTHSPNPKIVLSGLQTYIPTHLMSGLLPSALLDDYMFWQNSDDSLTGYLTVQDTARVPTRIDIALVRTDRAVVRR
jgi:hypothetical protein